MSLDFLTLALARKSKGSSDSYTKDEINELIETITTFNIQIVNKLPDKGMKYVFYFVKKADGVNGDAYDEWYDLTQDGTWEHLGCTDVDLSDYAKRSEVNSKFAQYENNLKITQKTEDAYKELKDYDANTFYVVE